MPDEMKPKFQVGDRVRYTLSGANVDATIAWRVCDSPCFYVLDFGAGPLIEVAEADLAPAGDITRTLED